MFILLGALTLVIYSVRKPNIIGVELGKRGVSVNNTIYPYNTLKSFWVEEDDIEPKILMQSEKVLMPYIIIPLSDTDPDIVREFLLNYLEEEEHREPLSQKLMEYLGF